MVITFKPKESCVPGNCKSELSKLLTRNRLWWGFINSTIFLQPFLGLWKVLPDWGIGSSPVLLRSSWRKHSLEGRAALGTLSSPTVNQLILILACLFCLFVFLFVCLFVCFCCYLVHLLSSGKVLAWLKTSLLLNFNLLHQILKITFWFLKAITVKMRMMVSNSGSGNNIAGRFEQLCSTWQCW